jgi:Dockerin type I domain/RTX calcium-binding nonapeptide repeat (4 copies)
MKSHAPRRKRLARKRQVRCLDRTTHLYLEPLEQRVLLTVDLAGVPNWVEQGPGTISGGNNIEGIPNSPQAGAVNAIAADPTDANRLFAASTNGGIWLTTNATAASPTWMPLTDQFTSLSIGDIAFSPLDATNNTLFAGTGRFSSGFGDGGPQTGLLKTTDGGATWTVLAQNDLANRNIVRVIPTSIGTVDTQVVLVATNSGVYRSTDGGATFGAAPVLAGNINDMAADPGNNMRYYAAIPGQGVFLTTNGGQNWNPANSNIPAATISNSTYINLAVHNNTGAGTNAVYAIVFSTAGGVTTVSAFRSANQAGNWTQMDNLPQVSAPRLHSMVADQTDANVVYFAGVPNDPPGPNPYGLSRPSGRIFRGDASAAAGSQWIGVIGNGADPDAGGPMPGTAPHPDSRSLTFDAAGNLINTNDGGVYKLINPNGPNRQWVSVNGDIRTAEFYSVAYDSLNNAYFGGLQDNGTPHQDNPPAFPGGSPADFNATDRTGADGGVVAVDNDQVAHPGTTIRYGSEQFLGRFTFSQKVFDNTNTFMSSTEIPLVVNGAGGKTLRSLAPSPPAPSGTFDFDNGIQFIQPFILNAVDPTRMLIGTTFLYESTDQGNTVTSLGGVANLNANGLDDDQDGVVDDGDEFGPMNPIGQVNATNLTGRPSTVPIAYGGTAGGMINPAVIWIGAGGNLRLRTNGGGLPAVVNNYPGAALVDIIMDPTDWHVAYMTDVNGSVYRAVTDDAGANTAFTNLTNNLGNFTSDVRTIEFVTGGAAPVLLVGGQGGVYRMVGPTTSTLWSEVGLNLPNSPVNDLHYDATDDLLLAGTWGRGAWTIANASFVLPVDGTLNVCGDEQYVNQDDQFLLIRDAGNPAMLDVFVNGVLEFSGPMAGINQINVFGVGGNDTLIVDSSNGLITVPDGIRYDGDGACPTQIDGEGGFGGTGFGYDRGFDTLQLIQTGGDTQTSDVYSVGPDIGSGTSIIMGPSGTQTIFFEELEPVIDLVPAASLVVNATAEHNAITYSDAAVPTDGLITIDNYESMEFSNKTNVVINAGSGDDVISADNALIPTGMGTLTINGDDGRDTITLAQLQTLTTVSGGAGNDTIDGSLVTAVPLNLSGGDGNDYIVGGSMGDQLFGDNGDDTLNGGAGNNTYTGGAGFDTVVVQGTPLADQILLSQTAAATLVSSINGNFRTDSINTIDAVTLDALAGADTIVVTQIDALVLAPAGSVPINVLGGPPGAGDSLRVFDDGLGDTDVQRLGADGTSGFFTIGPLAPISYEGVEYAALIPQNSITGGTGADGLGKLLVFKADPYEQNNSLPSATHMGAGATLNVDPTIDPPGFVLAEQQIPGDEDWYRFVAAETGVLDFQVYFREVPTLLNGRAGLPGNGALTVQVYDSDGLPPAGNPLGTGTPLVDPAGNIIGRHVAVPVVRNQVYNLRVLGATPDSINVYNFSVINVPTPIPQQVDLTAATDSGRSDTDDITNFDANLHGAAVFDIVLDDDRLDEFNNLNLLPDTVNDDMATVGFDYGVQVFNNGVSIGFAFLNAGNTWRFTATAGDLIEGHNNFISAAVWVRDRATPAVLGRGDLSQPLQVTLDTIAPANPTILIDPATSDTGVAAFPATIADRVTSDAATGFLGRAEADAIVRLWADGAPVSLGLVDGSDVLQGLTVAEPLDGDEAFPNGQWDLTPRFNLNDPSVGFPLDGFRQITATAEDVAGNESSRATPAVLNLFIDTQGPQVTGVFITSDPAFDLFDPKPSQSPTPLVYQLSIDLRDLPNRSNVDPNFLYDALAHNPGHDNDPAEDPGNYLLRGDHNGAIPIQTVQFIPNAPQNGLPATGTIVLTFFEPLPDDRFTLTLKDSLVDPAGNKLDGESNAVQPLEDPFFPSGDGQPGGDFVARFTVDSRPEIGVWAAGSVYIDTNGNYTFDPQNEDFVNRDITYVLGFTSDDVFAGNFALNPGDVADGFDKLAAYGKVNGQFRWLVDTDNDGVPNVNQVDPANINGVPFAGEFDGNTANGDEVGVFTGTTWWFDTNHDFKVDYALNSNLRGYPIVGDFDGDGFDDLATWADDHFQFDLANGALRGWNGTVDATINFGFIGVRERPVAADMDQDGIDDIGLFVPDRGGATPRETAEWYFLLSNDFHREIPDDGEGAAAAFAAIAGTVNTLDHPFTPIPFGKDIFAQFGDDYAVPVVGNFDPPFPGGSAQVTVGFTNPREAVDVNDDGYITPVDALLIINQLNTVGAHELGVQLASAAAAPYLDTNGDGYLTPIDALLVINRLNADAAAATAASSPSSSSSLRTASAMADGATPAVAAATSASSVTMADPAGAAVSTTQASVASPNLLFSRPTATPAPFAHGQFGGQFDALAGPRPAKADAALPDESPAVRHKFALIDGGLARLGAGRSVARRSEGSIRWDDAEGEALVSSLARDVARSTRRQSAKDAAFAELD